MSRSVPERRMPSLVASSRIFERIGSVVLAGTLAATATSPSWSCSRVIVSFMPVLATLSLDTTLPFKIFSSSSRGSGNVERRSNRIRSYTLTRSNLCRHRVCHGDDAARTASPIHYFPYFPHVTNHAGIILRTTPGEHVRRARGSRDHATSAGSLYRRYE